MNEQKQIGQLHAVVIQNLPEMTPEQRQRWIGDPLGLQKFLAGLIDAVATVASFITAKFCDQMNYDWSVAKLLKAGKYDWKNDDITDENFPSAKAVKRPIEYVMFHFNKAMSSTNVIAEMNKEACRPATIKELLNLGAKRPKLQLEYPIVALGSFAMLYGDRHVGYLDRRGSERHANLYDFDVDWGGRCRFLAVRN